MDEKNVKGTKNPFEDEPDKKPAKSRKKKKLLTRRTVAGIYLGIALCMLAVLTVNLVSTNEKVEKDLKNLDDICISVPDISFPEVPPEKKPPKEHRPVLKEVPDVNAEVIAPPDIPLPVAAAKYVLPVEGAVLKGYCVDSLVFSNTMQDFRTHGGVDIAAPLGSKVVAYADGVVRKTANDPFMGITVEIAHEAGVVSVYKNLGKELLAAEGDSVKAGQQIATVGQSAILEIADEPHLHFELWMNGECINAEGELSSLRS